MINSRKMFLGPPTEPKAGPPKPTITMNTEQGILGAGVERIERTVANVTKTERALSRGSFALGTAMISNSEYQKAGVTLKEQRPGLSDGEHFLKVGEKATVRIGSQVGAATGMGALIGLALPVGETAVSFVVGLGAGAFMMTPTGDGKNIGDRFVDLEEWGWSGIRGTGKGSLNIIKGLFG